MQQDLHEYDSPGHLELYLVPAHGQSHHNVQMYRPFRSALTRQSHASIPNKEHADDQKEAESKGMQCSKLADLT